jgi:hypothetical protein
MNRTRPVQFTRSVDPERRHGRLLRGGIHVDDASYAESRAELFSILEERFGPLLARSEDPDAGPRSLDAETTEALKALGYL